MCKLCYWKENLELCQLMMSLHLLLQRGPLHIDYPNNSFGKWVLAGGRTDEYDCTNVQSWMLTIQWHFYVVWLFFIWLSSSWIIQICLSMKSCSICRLSRKTKMALTLHTPPSRLLKITLESMTSSCVFKNLARPSPSPPPWVHLGRHLRVRRFVETML